MVGKGAGGEKGGDGEKGVVAIGVVIIVLQFCHFCHNSRCGTMEASSCLLSSYIAVTSI